MKTDTWFPDLVAYIDSYERTPFAYGVHDCALNVAGMVQAQTGVDHAAAWRGRYRTLCGGLRVIRKSGFKDHFDFVEKTFSEVHPAMAQNGDIAAVMMDAGWSLGCIIGPLIYVLTPNGTGILPRSMAEKAFRVE